MAERRSLASAVTAPVPGVEPEMVRAFVTQNATAERSIATPVHVTLENLDCKTDFRNLAETSTNIGSSGSTADLSRSRTANRFQPVGLIPITVRLHPLVAGALKRASLERELAGEEIFTQQEIVETVLVPWLKGQRFLA